MKIYTRFYLQKTTSSETHKKKKVIIGDHPVQYPDGAVTMDKDCEGCGGYGA